MKRIGILTYHRSMNYGALMQSAALASALQDKFSNAEVEIVDYCSRKMIAYYRLITLYRGKDSIFQLGGRIAMYRAFQRGLRELPLSPSHLFSDDCQKFFPWIGHRYDVLITGSDAVWNYGKRGLPNPYFLAGGGDYARFSYAASCNGLGIKTFSEVGADGPFLRDAFQRFDYIGVRDAQTQRLVKTVCPEAETHHNCDPSLLLGDLSKRDRSALIDKLYRAYRFDPEKPTIGLMLSNLNGSVAQELTRRLKAAYGSAYQTVSVYSYNRYADIPYIADLTPQEWSLIFGLFHATVSKYFHGTMFSLLNGTPVLAVGAEKSIEAMPNKIEDALGRMGLEDLYFPASGKEQLDWEKFMTKLDDLLRSPPLDRIRRGLEAERRSADSFFEALEAHGV